MKGPFNEAQAIQDYNSKFRDKTNGGYTQLEIKYSEEEEPKKETK